MIENRLIKTEGGRYAENNGQGVYVENADSVVVLHQEKKFDTAESCEPNKLEIKAKLSMQEIMTILTSFEDDLDKKYQVNIKIVDIDKGSINLTLEGSQEDLEKLETLFKAGQLTEVLGIPVEDVHIVTESDKPQLVFKIAGEIDTEVLPQLKAEIQKSPQLKSEILRSRKRDSISDLLTRIRNAWSVLHLTIKVFTTEMTRSIAQVLKKEGFIEDFEETGEDIDPISDMLTRIRNALAVRHPTTRVPTTIMTRSIAQVLKEEGFIEDFEETSEGINQCLVISLKYKGKNRQPIIPHLKRVSKPGLRVYSNSKDIPRVLGGSSIAIISTDKGIMTDREAQKYGIDGEIICYIS